MAHVIISSLYRVNSSQLENEPAGALPMAIAELSNKATDLVSRFRIGDSRTFDLSGLHHELLDLLLAGRWSPSSAAVVLHRVLAPIPIRDRASLALFLTNSIRADRLSLLAHGSLLTLRRAIALEDADVGQPALQQLEAALSLRTSSLFWNGPVLIVGDRVSPASLEAAIAQLGSDSDKHIVMVVPEDEKATSREVLLEHLRLQVRCVDDTQSSSVSPFLTSQAVQLLSAARPKSTPNSLYDAVARAVRWVWASPLRYGFAVSGR